MKKIISGIILLAIVFIVFVPLSNTAWSPVALIVGFPLGIAGMGFIATGIEEIRENIKHRRRQKLVEDLEWYKINKEHDNNPKI